MHPEPVQIPDSIKSLTTEKPSDSFLSVSKALEIPLDDIALVLKRSLTSKELASFELGLAYFKKDTVYDKNVIKNFLSLINESLVRSINDSDIDIENRHFITSQVKTAMDSLANNFDAFYNILNILNKQKNLLDVKCFILIIIGYAISLLKKIYNSTNK